MTVPKTCLHRTTIEIVLTAMILAIAAMPVCAASPQNPAATDSVAATDTTAHPRSWVKALVKGDTNPDDPDVKWPGFVKFCLKTYRWFDNTFNSYDPEYVLPIKKKWKVTVREEYWADAYFADIHEPTGGDISFATASPGLMNVGISVQYASVSIGYSTNLTGIFTDNDIDMRKVDLRLVTSRLLGEILIVENMSGTKMRTLKPYFDDKVLFNFPGFKMYSINISALYLFDHERYSHGAAFGYSKHQIKSAGSWMAGFKIAHQNVDMDFSTLPAEALENLPGNPGLFQVHYNDFSLMGGYGYNWVFAPHFLFNITGCPGIGITHNTEMGYDAGNNRLSLNLQLQGGVSYWNKSFFCGITARTLGHWYMTGSSSMLSNVILGTASVGVMF